VVPAVILAAGASRRMGSPKALLPLPGGVFATRIIRAFHAAGVDDVTLVTGDDHDAIAAALDIEPLSPRPRIVRNPDPSRGQLSSLWVGMDAALGPDSEALLVTLVDVPLIDPATVARVVDVWRAVRAPIVRPARGEQHGHPVLFDAALFGALRAAPLDAGAKTVVRAFADRIVNVPVSDEGCLVDIDTPDDYRSLRV
jgi:molybdenum cofactor cytidylyltransferase